MAEDAGAIAATATTAGQPPANRAAFGFIFASAVTTAITIGLMVPIMPALLKQFTVGDTAAATDWNTLFVTAGGAMTVISGPVLGLFSDRFGRRPVLLISLFGQAVDFLFMAFAPSLIWLLVGRLISGATSAAFSTANAYVADVAAPQDRAKAFGWLGSAFGFGFMAGPALGGLLGQYDLRLPFMVAAGLTLANAVYGALVLPESLPRERRAERFHWARANPVGSLAQLRSHPDLLSLAAIQFLFQLANMVWPSVFVLYTSYRYGWTPVVTGFYMMAGSTLGVGVQTFLVGPVVRRIGERGALIVGAAAQAIALAWYGFAPSGYWYMLGMPISCLQGLLIPGLQGIMTSRVPPNEQGQLQGANQSLGGIASVIGPSVFGLTFAWAVRHPGLHAPGLAMELAALAMVVCTVLGIRAHRRSAAAAA
jgi:DHA1 family tetracycline resistance protein-like MFS transporter